MMLLLCLALVARASLGFAVSRSIWGSRYQGSGPAPSVHSWVMSLTMQLPQDKAEIRDLMRPFEPAEYHPPRWARNSHLHTILGSGDFESKLFGDGKPVDYERVRYVTADEDFIDVDFLNPSCSPSEMRNDTLVIVMHGLEGSSYAPLTKRFAEIFASRGFHVAAPNARGCSGSTNNIYRQYHLGFTDDLRYLLDVFKRERGGQFSKFYLTGFSMGANVIVKFLGEEGAAAAEAGVQAAAVACVPFRPLDSIGKFSKGGFVETWVYQPSFLNAMKDKVAVKAGQPSVGELDLDLISQAKTVLEFDESYTSKVFGFESAEDYYTQVDATPFLSKAHVPLYVMNAMDDPLTVPDSRPVLADLGDAPVIVKYHRYGGHCGFLLPKRGRLQGQNRFLPVEANRFIEHIDKLLREREWSQPQHASHSSQPKRNHPYDEDPATTEQRHPKRSREKEAVDADLIPA